MNRQQRRAKARRKPDKPKPASRADMVNLAYDVVYAALAGVRLLLLDALKNKALEDDNDKT